MSAPPARAIRLGGWWRLWIVFTAAWAAFIIWVNHEEVGRAFRARAFSQPAPMIAAAEVMPTFRLTMPGGEEYEVDAPDADAAIGAVTQAHGQRMQPAAEDPWAEFRVAPSQSASARPPKAHGQAAPAPAAASADKANTQEGMFDDLIPVKKVDPYAAFSAQVDASPATALSDASRLWTIAVVMAVPPLAFLAIGLTGAWVIAGFRQGRVG
ncbi:hypothetical protein [Methylocella sp.]|uniref:hypothetical protein n=1 Tax=Methylocella sp. TaxID=1978226 RepID=UPI0035B025D9